MLLGKDRLSPKGYGPFIYKLQKHDWIGEDRMGTEWKRKDRNGEDRKGTDRNG